VALRYLGFVVESCFGQGNKKNQLNYLDMNFCGSSS